jgi:NAD(P)-dependent dehydrogenase (short-subunit alcohol dehydrogenase family)
LVNNAGFGLFNPIAAVTEEQFDGLFNVHLKGPFFLTQTLLPLMVDGAGIVNVTSATTRVATAGVAPYAAFKGGLEVLTRYMAKEFGDRRIRANSVSPGNTYFEGGVWNTIKDNNPELYNAALALNPTGRMGTPQEMANAAVFLASRAASFITGTNLVVDGALTRGVQF